MGTLKFGVYKYRATDVNDILLRKELIVLKDENDNIVGWTNFHKYARSGKRALARSIYAGQDRRCVFVSLLLNYVFFDKYHITKLTDIEPMMVKDFLTDYGLCRLPGDNQDTHRAKGTVNLCISTIIDFLDLMIADNPTCKMKVSDLYRTERLTIKSQPRK